MTPELRKLLTDWLAWAEAGAPEHPLFRRQSGLCWAADRFAYTLGDELMDMFKADGLDVLHPFGVDAYSVRHLAATQHEDPNRLAWVRSKISESAGAA